MAPPEIPLTSVVVGDPSEVRPNVRWSVRRSVCRSDATSGPTPLRSTVGAGRTEWNGSSQRKLPTEGPNAGSERKVPTEGPNTICVNEVGIALSELLSALPLEFVLSEPLSVPAVRNGTGFPNGRYQRKVPTLGGNGRSQRKVPTRKYNIVSHEACCCRRCCGH